MEFTHMFGLRRRSFARAYSDMAISRVVIKLKDI
jgi:hypothetical protein